MGETRQDENRTINTPHFGELEIDKSHIFEFPEGMLGFERLKSFVLISEMETEPFKWLISLDEPDIGFPLLSPWYLDVNYKAGSSIDLDKQVVFVVITLEDEKGYMTANMKAPVIMDVDSQEGEQIIIPSDKYKTNLVIPTKKKK